MTANQKVLILDGAHAAVGSDVLLACCLCGKLLQDPVQLNCLHNCCQQCFTVALSTSSSLKVECNTCSAITPKGSEQPNSFMTHQVQLCTAIAEYRICGVCTGNGESDKPASVWCQACGHSLCEDCIAGHKLYNKRHATQSLAEIERLEELRPPSSASMCPVHKRSLEIACVSCEQVKCLSCWAVCYKSQHKMHVVGEGAFDDYVGTVVGAISSLEKDLRQKIESVKKPSSILSDLRASRAHHLEQIGQRKQRIIDAVEKAYCEMECKIKTIYEDLEKETGNVSASAGRITSNFSDAQMYIRRLVESNRKCDILNQQKVVRERLRVLSAELDAVSDTLCTMGAVSTDPPLPDDFESVVRDWIAIPLTQSASSLPKPRHFFFGAAAACSPEELDCNDVALTKDGRLLLAAGWYGLVELSSTSGRELSSWLPPIERPPARQHSGSRRSDSSDDDDDMLDDPIFGDSVEAVAALSDGRVAAGLHDAKLVVLLRRRGQDGVCGTSTSASGDEWIVDLRLERLQWTPRRISAARGDVLIVAEHEGRRLQLMNVSSGRCLGAEQRREYSIDSLAVTAHAVITAGSYCASGTHYPVTYVLDAHRLSDGHEQLWRHNLNECSDSDVDYNTDLYEGVYYVDSMCADSAGSVLYAAMRDHYGMCSENSLVVINMMDGGELRRVSASCLYNSELLPVRLPRYGAESILEFPDRAKHWEQRCSVRTALCYYPTAGACWMTVVHGCNCKRMSM